MGVYTMGRAAELLGVSVDSLRYRADAGQIDTVRTTNGQRLIDGVALARLAMKLAADQAAEDARRG
jgi:DNA-binding transcriptional MerR regulator